jgi:hypothetical protein
VKNGTRSGVKKIKKDTLEQVAERIVLETYNEAFSKFPRGGKVSNEALTDSLVLFFILGAKWQQEQNKNLYSDEEVLEIIDLLFHRYASSFRIDAKEYFLQFKS